MYREKYFLLKPRCCKISIDHYSLKCVLYDIYLYLEIVFRWFGKGYAQIVFIFFGQSLVKLAILNMFYNCCIYSFISDSTSKPKIAYNLCLALYFIVIQYKMAGMFNHITCIFSTIILYIPFMVTTICFLTNAL